MAKSKKKELAELQEKLSRLKKTYADFLKSMDDIEKQEKGLASKIRSAVDQEKIHGVLQKIVDIQD